MECMCAHGETVLFKVLTCTYIHCVCMRKCYLNKFSLTDKLISQQTAVLVVAAYHLQLFIQKLIVAAPCSFTPRKNSECSPVNK